MRQPLRAIVRWSVIEVVLVQTVGAWLASQVVWPIAWAASWVVYVLAGREGSRYGRFRYAPLAAGAVALVGQLVMIGRIALKDIDPTIGGGSDSPIQVVVMTLLAGLWGASWGLLGGLISRLHQPRALLASCIGIAPVLLALLQLDRGSSTAISRVVLTPATLVGGLVRPHNIGTATNEGTPVDLAATMAGVALCALMYGAVAYGLLAWIARRRAHPGDLNQVGA
jgi:hypothetical protein